MINPGHCVRLLVSTLLVLGGVACRPTVTEPEYIPRTAAVKFLREATEAYSAGDMTKAMIKVEAAVKEDPGYYLTYSFQSMLLGHEGDAEAAAEAMQHALEIEPDFARGHLMYGVFMERLGNKEKADSAYRQALALFDAEREAGVDEPVAQTYRAVAIYLLEGRVRGQSALDKLLLAHPGHPLATVVRDNMRNEKREFFLDWVVVERGN